MNESINLTRIFSVVEPEDDRTSISEILKDIGLVGQSFWIPILLVFGAVGNFLSILVFLSTPKYRQQSASYYLSALAISDTLFLLQEILYIVSESYYNSLPVFYGALCPVTVYFYFVTRFLSSYLTVAFSVERFIAIHYPLSRPRLCTCSKARKAIAGLTLFSLVIFSYSLVIYGINFEQEEDSGGKNSAVLSSAAVEIRPFKCDILPQYYRVGYIFHIIDTVISFVIPFFLIAFFNLRIVLSVHKHRRKSVVLYDDAKRVSSAGNSNSTSDSNRGTTSNNRANENASDQRVTKLLLIVSAMYLILNLPYNLCTVIRNFLLLDGDESFEMILTAVESWSYYLFCVNFAINFILYNFSGSQFRSALKTILFGNRASVTTNSQISRSSNIEITVVSESSHQNGEKTDATLNL